ncbi:MAG TPA: CBS domain-containing protein [Anaerolineaceae bacterium]|nr:CBS domain-containing protein [Anaerolineaceae bacterium]
MNVRQSMKRSVIAIHQNETILAAVSLLRQHHIGTLPVVDDDGRLVGLLTLRSLLDLVMPDFVHLLDTINFVHDFGAIESRQPSEEDLARPVSDVMRPPVFVTAESGLLRAAAILHENDLKDLPVVDLENKLVGLASHVDIGIALMSNWASPPQP